MSAAATITETLQEAQRQLSDSPTPKLDAELLLVHLLSKPRSYLYAHPEQGLSTDQASRFGTLLRERMAGKPVAYLTGQREFWSLPFAVNAAVLVPRPETELLVEQALAIIPVDAALNIADLGTGSGCIAIAIAHERPNCSIIAVDRSSIALKMAQHNAASIGVNNVAFVQSDWCQSLLPGHFDIIVANPPYVCANDPSLENSDIRHEPVDALASGTDGLDDLRLITSSARRYLKDGGTVLLEHGDQQGPLVRRMLSDQGFSDTNTWTDMAGRDRVTIAVHDL